MKFFARLSQFWPQFFLFLLLSLLFFANYVPGTYLTGWDNLHPEFAPVINLERAWHTAWQEYQGLGLLAGMAHGAELFRQILLWPLMLLLPTELFRYVFVYLSLLFGVWGAYSALNFLLKKANLAFSQPAAFLGAIFYLLNLGTLQNFYMPYEPFVVFYAVFPYLLLTLWLYLYSGKKGHLLVFALTSLVASASFYVQTIFLVYFLLLFLSCAVYFFTHLDQYKWQKIFLATLLTLLINAFWLLPNLYFALSSSQTTVEAKNNMMATEQISLRNASFGNLPAIARLEAYWFDYQDFDQSANSVYLLDPWKTHLNQPVIGIISYLPALLIVFALALLWTKKNNDRRFLRWYLTILLLLCYFVLAADNPPFAFIYSFLQDRLPLFEQVFRSSFTKWVVPAVFTYSLGVAIFFAFLFNFFQKIKINWQQITLLLLTSTIFLINQLALSWPSFTGHFFYSRLRIEIPDAYFQVFTFFKTADQNARIANLPQHSFYGWQWNDWGYRGSGFLWYGIKQPILDRAFDVWSSADENYYWQLQSALDTQDIAALEQVFSKYDVRYLLLDQSVVNRNTRKPFNFANWQTFLTSSDQITLVDDYDFIQIYQFNEPEQLVSQDNISLWENLPTVQQVTKYQWQDRAFTDLGDYLEVNEEADYLYPFASLFTNHSQAELEFNLTEDEQNFYLESLLNLEDISGQDYQLLFTDYLLAEASFLTKISWQSNNGVTNFHLQAILPTILYADQKLTFHYDREISLDSQLCLAENNCSLEINGQELSDFAESGEVNILLRSQLRNSIALKEKEGNQYYDYSFLDLMASQIKVRQSTIKGSEFKPNLLMVLPKVSSIHLGQNLLTLKENPLEAKNCRLGGLVYKEIRNDGNLYSAVNANSCDHFTLEDLDHNQSWLVKTQSQSLGGLPMTFAVQVDSFGRSPIESYLPKSSELSSAYFFLPKTEQFNQGYTFYFATDAYGREMSQNLLSDLRVYYWPYNFTKSLHLEKNGAVEEANLSNCSFGVDKKGLWLYQIELNSDCRSPQTIKLSQAYDSAWLALSKVDGQWQMLKHNKFSNWANGWSLTGQEETIYVFFWPQLLEYFGLGLLGLTFLGLGINILLRRR